MNHTSCPIKCSLEPLALLFIRLILAYGFYETVIPKWQNIDPTISWFASMGVPLASFVFYYVAIFESLAIISFVFGVLTRTLAFLLMPVLIAAIFLVHFSNGYSVGNNGFEIPLYYLVFLFALFAFGAGKFSLDAFLAKNKSKS